MFMNVITGYFSTFKVIQCNILVRVMSKSNKFTKLCALLYAINISNIKMISPMVIEISLERTNFESLSLGACVMVKKFICTNNVF